jgi:oligopeptide/dipeptide ABC transporter ATP-binding protein
MNPLVEINNLVKYFDLGQGQIVHAVDNVSLQIHSKEVVGLVGESGSGKSTLGKAVLGLHHKTSGNVTYAGELLPQKYRSRDFQKHAKTMQMIFQDPYSSLNPRMTVGEIIGEGLKLNKALSASEINQRAAHWLTLVGLSADHMSRYPHEFSGGQRQRIGVARALILEPDFVVCDEPISALDVSVQAQVVNLLAELKESMGLTLLFIAHDLSMVRYISDRMAVMYLGGLVEVGDADEVFFKPLHPYTKTLIASNPEADPRSERQRVSTTIQGEIPSPVNIPAGCRFANRCPQAMPVCHQITPVLKTPTVTKAEEHFDKNRQVACHLYD